MFYVNIKKDSYNYFNYLFVRASLTVDIKQEALDFSLYRIYFKIETTSLSK